MLSFKDLYVSYATDVYRFAYWLTGNKFEAEDITSETFVRAWVRRSQIRTETLKAYLFTIARNIYLESQRKKKHQVPLEGEYIDSSPGPDKKNALTREIKEAMDMLLTFPELDRMAFIMRVYHELSYSEIARVLNLSLPNVKVKIHRVRKKLIANRIEKEVT